MQLRYTSVYFLMHKIDANNNKNELIKIIKKNKNSWCVLQLYYVFSNICLFFVVNKLSNILLNSFYKIHCI